MNYALIRHRIASHLPNNRPIRNAPTNQIHRQSRCFRNPRGVRGFKGSIEHIRLQRDVFYIADKTPRPESEPKLLRKRNDAVYFRTGPDQFFPLGDNSPASSDARYWNDPYVKRELLVGKAVFIYWPHTWNMPPFFPNFRRMKPIQ